MENGILTHPVLGELELRKNARARRFSFRMTEGRFRVTVPPLATREDLDRCIKELLPRLQALKKRHVNKHPKRIIDTSFRIEADEFRMLVQEGEVEAPTARLMHGVLTVTCPVGTDYENKGLQEWLVHVAEESLRYVARRVLPIRLAALAREHGFRYSEVAIHKTRGRWGSCTSKGKINLSLYLLLLPRHLQDYVMLHELCHTREMNHSARFWAQMDAVTQNRALAYREEMKGYDTRVV